MKNEVAHLKEDVDYLKSTDFTSLLEAADDLDDPKTLEIPTNTKDIHKEEATVDEPDVEIYEEHIDIREEIIY